MAEATNCLRISLLCDVLFSCASPSCYSFEVAFQKAVRAICHHIALCIGIFMPFCASGFANKCLVVKVTGIL